MDSSGVSSHGRRNRAALFRIRVASHPAISNGGIPSGVVDGRKRTRVAVKVGVVGPIVFKSTDNTTTITTMADLNNVTLAAGRVINTAATAGIFET